MSGTRSLPQPLKQLAGLALTALWPQARFGRSLFLLGHMRCGSTALSRVLCAHPEISGYGEAHVPYRGLAGPGQLALNQLRRRGWRPGARYLFDKILHDDLDHAAPAAFFDGRAVFLLRQPEAAIRSIRRLFSAIGSAEYASDALAADYYAARLANLARLWKRFPAERRIGLTYEELTADPDRTLAGLSGFLGLDQALANAYPAAPPPAPGTGDPLGAPWHDRIINPAPPDRPAGPTLALAEGRLAALVQAHCELTARFTSA